MKNFKKLFFCIFSVFFLTFLFNGKCYAGGKTKVIIADKKFTINNNNAETQKEEILEHIKNMQSEKSDGYLYVPILDGGTYHNTAHNEFCESHHLISRSFCVHNKFISPYDSPSVLIPKPVHYKTGSHIRSGISRKYIEIEKLIYNKCIESGMATEDALYFVYKFGIIDLKFAFNLSGYVVTTDDIKTSTPVRKTKHIDVFNKSRKSLTPLKNRRPFPKTTDTPYINNKERIYNEILEFIRTSNCPTTVKNALLKQTHIIRYEEKGRAKLIRKNAKILF